MPSRNFAVRSSRVPWENLPHEVRDALQGRLGDEVVETASQSGGFSTGFASRLRLRGGSRAFVKAVPTNGDPKALRLYEREAQVASYLPETLPVPPFLGWLTAGGWFALMFEDAGGRTPEVPWRDHELRRVLEALVGLAIPANEVSQDAKLDTWGGDPDLWVGWQHVIDRGLWDGLPSWAVRCSEGLAQLERGFAKAAAGDSLIHSDLRADNIVLREDAVVFVDWAWAAHGQAWLDPLILALTAGVQGHPHPEAVFQSSTTARKADGAAVNSVLSALAGRFVAASREAREGNEVIRSFQNREAMTALSWLQQRLGWR